MAINYASLKQELNQDPRAYGYAAAPTFQGKADLLNLRRDGTNGGPAITVRRTDVRASEILEQIDNRDLITNANNLEAALFESIMQQGNALRLAADDGTDTRILGDLRRLLQNPGPQGSRARLGDIVNRSGSRAEELFGRDTVVGAADVDRALNGT